MKQCVRLRSMKRRQVARSEFSIATSTLRPPTLLTRMSMGRPSASALWQRSSHTAGSAISAAKGPGFSIALPHLVGGSGKRVRIARDKHDIGAGLCGRKRNHAAEPPAAPCDKYAFAVQPELVEHRHVADPTRFVACSFILWRLPAMHQSLATGDFDLCVFSGPSKRAAATLSNCWPIVWARFLPRAPNVANIGRSQ